MKKERGQFGYELSSGRHLRVASVKNEREVKAKGSIREKKVVRGENQLRLLLRESVFQEKGQRHL